MGLRLFRAFVVALLFIRRLISLGILGFWARMVVSRLLTIIILSAGVSGRVG